MSRPTRPPTTASPSRPTQLVVKPRGVESAAAQCSTTSSTAYARTGASAVSRPGSKQEQEHGGSFEDWADAQATPHAQVEAARRPEHTPAPPPLGRSRGTEVAVRRDGPLAGIELAAEELFVGLKTLWS